MAETTEFNDEFNAENCCTNPNLPHEVNRARCLASAALIFGILNVFQFGQILSRYWYYAGVVSGLGALPSLLSASMLICCSPKQINRPGHGARHFTRAGCASAAGSCSAASAWTSLTSTESLKNAQCAGSAWGGPTRHGSPPSSN